MASNIPVHHYMNYQVQSNWNPKNWGLSSKLSIAQQDRSTVVIYMQKAEWFSLEDQEDGVQQLEVLSNIVQII